MRVLIVLGEPFFPQSSGGTQTSTLEISNQMAAAGHTIFIASKSRKKSLLGVKTLLVERLLLKPYYRAPYFGLDNFRATNLLAALPTIMRDLKPDAILLQAPNAMKIATYLSDQNFPFVVYWRDVEVRHMGGRPDNLKARFIANSGFTANFYRSQFGIDSTVIPPIVRRERCVETKSEATRDHVTFFGNSKEKGIEIALAVAGLLPSIKFEFVESWILDRANRKHLKRRISTLPNARFTSLQRDVRPIFARSKVVFIPSQWEEAWGRVATEAHLNGIPVVGSDIGGLSESIGPGGVLLDASSPPSVWAEAVHKLWTNTWHYDDLARAALRYSQRLEMSPPEMVGNIVDILEKAMEDRSLTPARLTAKQLAMPTYKIDEARP